MNRPPSTNLSIALLVGMIVLGGGVMVWLSQVSAERITPAQSNLLEIADWMVKASIGAILGLIGARSLPPESPPPATGVEPEEGTL